MVDDVVVGELIAVVVADATKCCEEVVAARGPPHVDVGVEILLERAPTTHTCGPAQAGNRETESRP